MGLMTAGLVGGSMFQSTVFQSFQDGTPTLCAFIGAMGCGVEKSYEMVYCYAEPVFLRFEPVGKTHENLGLSNF